MNLTLTPAERRLQVVLRVFVVLFALAVLIYGIGPFATGLPLLGPLAPFMRRLPFVAFSVVKVFTLMLVCLYAAGDPRDRLGLVWVAAGGHAISIAAMGGFLLLTDTTTPIAVGGSVLPLGRVLWSAIALDGAILIILLGYGLLAHQAQRDIGPQRDPPWTAPRPTSEDRMLRVALVILAVVLMAGGVAYELGGLLPVTRDAFTNVPFVTNSVVKVGTLALVAFYVARDVAPRIGGVGILYVAHVVSVITQLLFWLGAASEPAMPLFGREVPVRSVLIGHAALDAGIAALLLILWRRAYRARFSARFLSIRGYRTLVQLADVVVHGPDEAVDPATVAQNVDRYFRNIRSARGRFSHRLALFLLHFHPLLYLKPPFPELGAADRMGHLKTHFYRDVALKIVPDAFRRFVAGFIKVAKQIAYVGYYSDPAVEPFIGYTPFSRRPHPPVAKQTVSLKVTTPPDLDRLHEDTDICIIGTGAGASVLAHSLARDHCVLMLERGQFVQPAQFTENEVEMIGKLYDDGVFQQTRDLRFTILQGSCVGGTTVVNNAVCFAPPQEVIEGRWNDAWRWKAGIDYAELRRCTSEVEQLISVAPQHDNLNPSGQKYLDGIARLGLHPPELEFDVVRANIANCLGCGYCNIGCAYGRKLSMLDRVLPAAQAANGERLRIISEARVERILQGKSHNGRHRADIVCARLPDGRLLTVRARKIVVAAGTIASSWLLQQSGIGKGLPVGEGLSFNMGAPLTADFGPDPANAIPGVNGRSGGSGTPPLNSFAGLQISHYGKPSINRGWVFETWFNPPVAQAINMPGWFEQHYVNMRRYPYLMGVGALVGTESNAHIEPALTGGPDVIYEPTPGDRRKLADALIELGRILFAAGARRVMVNSWNYYEFTSPDQLPELIRITLDPEELALGTGHPQGGNAISQKTDWGVIGPDFRVHGWENLYVCDASVFPSSLTVNPQLTVMSLARYASSRIADT
jgi:choline dehydrogenase-like flavoprotein